MEAALKEKEGRAHLILMEDVYGILDVEDRSSTSVPARCWGRHCWSMRAKSVLWCTYDYRW